MMQAPPSGKTPILPIATHVMPDEPCFRLDELNLLTGDNKAYHRYQIVWVVRANHLAEHRTDMGATSEWADTPELRLIGGEFDEAGCAHVYEKVGNLKDWADWWRGQEDFRKDLPPSTLMEDFRKGIEEQRKASVGQSTFGPALVKQR